MRLLSLRCFKHISRKRAGTASFCEEETTTGPQESYDTQTRDVASENNMYICPGLPQTEATTRLPQLVISDNGTSDGRIIALLSRRLTRRRHGRSSGLSLLSSGLPMAVAATVAFAEAMSADSQQRVLQPILTAFPFQQFVNILTRCTIRAAKLTNFFNPPKSASASTLFFSITAGGRAASATKNCAGKNTGAALYARNLIL